MNSRVFSKLDHSVRHFPAAACFGWALMIATTTWASSAAKWQPPPPSETQRNGTTLFFNALVAGGTHSQEQLRRCQQQFEHLCVMGNRSITNVDCPRERARLLFQLLHQVCLTGPYEKSCWQVDQSLNGGSYNCVTSTILYLCLCRYHGVTIDAMAKPSHVYCRLASDPADEIETTCKQWFQRKADKRSAADIPGSNQDTERSAITTSAAQPGRLITDAQLIGKVYYNRAVNLLQRNDYQQAMECLERACEMDPSDQSAQKNRSAAWNNWSLELADCDKFEQAADLIQRGLASAPADQYLLANDLYIHHNWAMELCRLDRYQQALELLERCHHRRPDVDLFDTGRWAVYQQWAESLLAAGNMRPAIRLLAEARVSFGNRHESPKAEISFWQDYLTQLDRQGRALQVQQLREELDSVGFDLTTLDF